MICKEYSVYRVKEIEVINLEIQTYQYNSIPRAQRDVKMARRVETAREVGVIEMEIEREGERNRRQQLLWQRGGQRYREQGKKVRTQVSM